ncbi:tyrosine-type recombinase/integrase [Pseudidiomarina sp. 1APP75-27a]|uniref:tyrosine-type recombinase/integrase n=1 Tax=Pseudidiomarina terrestris TaxID=2820060 RepID=UPI002B05BCE6|nr:tyrosine-type recombinase/integrase [Pseudidiomarina sp. 1APP75-27a]MEA3587941.1 tyrosine-type recombinase/integrase [Pseudidiomarina sp. 1APP75-27a]
MSGANPDAARFRHIVRQLQADKQDNPYDWNEPYDVREIERAGDIVFVDAYTTVTGADDRSSHYDISLREALHNWEVKHGVNKSLETQRKVPNTVKLFLNFLEVQDVSLQSVSRRDVYDFIEYLAQHYAKNTVSGHISRLKVVWELAKDRCDVTGDNPFHGHKMDGTSETKKYELFTPSELQALNKSLDEASKDRKLIFLLGLYTGARLSEICNIKAGNIMQAGDHYYYHIEKGKTKDATRNVPIPPELVADTLALREGLADDDLLFSVDSKTYSRWFSVLKSSLVDDSRKVFHSLRVGFSTALKRCDVHERYAAEILGHKRGETMSYGYYAKENEVHKLASEAAKAFSYIKFAWLTDKREEGR